MNPYAYVGGNPETMSDPTGNMYAPPGGGGGGGNGGGGGTSPPPSCDWWCQVQNDWHGITQSYQDAWNNTANDYKAAWNDEVHFAQQTQETITHVASQGISFAHIVVGVIVAAAIGVGSYLVWHYTHRWTRPDWANLPDNEGIPHPRYSQTGGIIPSKQHVLRGHVDANKSHLQYLANRFSRNETSFYDEYAAQWAVDDALQNMTSQQKQDLQDMIDNPRKGGELVLNGILNDNIGYGYRYNKDGTLTYVAATRSYRVIIAVDANGNPFIVTAFPTV